MVEFGPYDRDAQDKFFSDVWGPNLTPNDVVANAEWLLLSEEERQAIMKDIYSMDDTYSAEEGN